jgi:ATP-dependent helicase HepA
VSDFIPGQRWISDTELQMGLGTVLNADHRSVTLIFHATEETRIYAKQTAPLTRVRFAAGDTVRSAEGWELHITDVEEHDGLLVYIGTREGEIAVLDETKLDNFIQLNRPADRLFTGQIDKNKWFDLRYQTLLQQNRLSHSELYGLTGARTSLIPHQLYIAHEVANRYAPRVLLADEVGLGKTIEAGLILHQQLITERAQRVLIVVPETLIHQWLVEMLRRFNLHFSIFDEERSQAISESNNQENPFHSEQLVLCSINFLASSPHQAANAIQGNWDLLIVDEAHHLEWSETEPSREYQLVDELSRVTPGVLLLTATPEQLGKASHFARLRLLDQDRFADFESFLKEEASYEPIAEGIEKLLGHEPVDATTRRVLQSVITETDQLAILEQLGDPATDLQQQQAARGQLVDYLLDRHGTGRIQFRNTRHAIKGFPQRQSHAYPLELPAEYALAIQQAQTTSIDWHALISPERLYSDQSSAPTWTELDPRVSWLRDHLQKLKPAKVLVISSSAETTLELAETLRVRFGIHSAVFHEGMSIVERDRAAAYFADPEYGTQVLLCSEIGSEGRNFQFAHHLVLFDLPVNPDLLEQRIGRLDRIGQTQTIQIHVPYLQGSAQQVLYHWYHEGLNAFEKTCPAGQSVYQQVQADLFDALHHINEGIDDLTTLIETTRQLYTHFSHELNAGRDRLLEYNSCRPEIANQLAEQIRHADQQSTVAEYLENVFDCFGIESEIHSSNSLVIQPGDHMQTHSFPGLPDDGMTITYDRDTALSHEDMQFMTWEHPLISGAIDMVLSNETGNSSFATVKYPKLQPGSLLLECLYVMDTASTHEIQAKRYLPPTLIRTLLDTQGNDHSKQLDYATIQQTHQEIPHETAKTIIRTHSALIRTILAQSTHFAQLQAPEVLLGAHQQTRQTLEKEINRLEALRHVNPNIRDDEINFFKQQWFALNKVLDEATIRLDALRIVIAT